MAPSGFGGVYVFPGELILIFAARAETCATAMVELAVSVAAIVSLKTIGNLETSVNLWRKRVTNAPQ